MENYDYAQAKEAAGGRDFLTALFKHKVKVITVFIGIFLPALIYTFTTAPVYESEANIMVKIGREYLNQPEVGNADRSQPLMALNQEEVVNSEIQILTSKDLAEKVITSITLENFYPEILSAPVAGVPTMEIAIAKFQKGLKIERIKKTNVLKVSFQHKSPGTAAKAVNLLVELFKEKHLQVFSDPKSSFLGMQLGLYKEKLQSAENNLQSFKQKKEVYALDEQRTLILRQRTELDTSLKNSLNTIQELNNKSFTLKGQIKNIEDNKSNYTNTEMDRIIVETKAKLLDLRLKEQELLKKYTDSNRLVVNIRNEIKLINAFLFEQEKDITEKVRTANPVYREAEIMLIKIESDLNAQKGKAAVLKQQVAELDGKVRSLDFSEKEMQKLKRDQDISEKSYRSYQEKVEAARIADEMNRLKLVNISVIQDAGIPITPVKPLVAINIALALLLGLMFGVGSALLAESTSPSFSTPEKVERRFGIPVLTTISLKEV